MGVGIWLDSRGDQGGGGIVGGDRCERCDRGVVREGFLGLGGKFGIYTWRRGVVCGIVMGKSEGPSLLVTSEGDFNGLADEDRVACLIVRKLYACRIV